MRESRDVGGGWIGQRRRRAAETRRQGAPGTARAGLGGAAMTAGLPMPRAIVKGPQDDGERRSKPQTPIGGRPSAACTSLYPPCGPPDGGRIRSRRIRRGHRKCHWHSRSVSRRQGYHALNRQRRAHLGYPARATGARALLAHPCARPAGRLTASGSAPGGSVADTASATGTREACPLTPTGLVGRGWRESGPSAAAAGCRPSCHRCCRQARRSRRRNGRSSRSATPRSRSASRCARSAAS